MTLQRYLRGPTQGGGDWRAQLVHGTHPRDGVQMVRLFGQSVDVLVLGSRRKCSKHEAGGIEL